jgi:hypothetical protein
MSVPCSISGHSNAGHGWCRMYQVYTQYFHLNKDQLTIIGLTAGFRHSEKLYCENDVGMNSCLGKPLPMETLKKALARYQPPQPSVALNVNMVHNLSPSSSLPQLLSKRKMDTSGNLTIELIQPIMDCSIYQLPNVDNVPTPGKTQCLDAVGE